MKKPALHVVLTVALVASWGSAGAAEDTPQAPFAIRVVDAATSRGIPLVSLETTFNASYVTDSNGVVAFEEPGLMDRQVFFRPTSDGYEFPAPGLAMGGVTIRTTPNTSATLVMHRTMLAERLYRITGAGIYRDTVKLGQPAPVAHPLINSGVIGQDSTLCTVANGKIFWIWGDTTRLSHPLGNFGSTGAWSDLPDSGGLPVDVGINLNYVGDKSGFVKSMVPRQPGDASNLYWISCLMTVPDKSGKNHILAWADNVAGTSMKTLKRRVLEFDEAAQEFRVLTEWPTTASLQPSGHGVRVRMPIVPGKGKILPATTSIDDSSSADTTSADYMLFTGNGQTRVRANYESACDPHQYDTVGNFDLQPVDATTQKPFKPHNCSIAWNGFRHCWTMILSELGGSSMLGEAWYLEAPEPTGPWRNAIKIVTHKNYTLYNPLQHPELTPADSPYLYFEGTYTKTFSGAETATPWYDYNQIMFRLDLRDHRLRAIAN